MRWIAPANPAIAKPAALPQCSKGSPHSGISALKREAEARFARMNTRQDKA